MKKNWFEGCCNLQALKERYKELAKAYHPDINPEAGDEVMQQINAQYDELVKRLSRVSSDGCTEATAEEARSAQDLAMQYREIIMKLINLSGLVIELCGAWVWISGETYANREA
ncbi:MAG: J domain-containing protein, partial [Clostridia bacterium]|nr:J domain-containing protein [Clostridia bacterium]